VNLRARHLRDDRLFDCYVAERGGEPLDPPAAEHLADCAECASRYEGLTRSLEGVRHDLNAETDAIFTDDRLLAQRQQIARRLEQLGHAARVISFPGHGATHPPRRATGVAARWIAGAAAAGLFIGICVGTFVDSARRGTPRTITQMASASQRPIVQPAILSSRPPVADTVAEPLQDDFLQEVELAGDRPHTAELVALDELTPHVRPVQTGLH